MILFSILMVMLLTITAFLVVTIGFGGGLFIILFADVIVCAVFLIVLMKKALTKK